VRRRVLTGVVVLAAAAGCGTNVSVGEAAGLPRCAPAGNVAEGGTVLMAQSVPTAGWLPCVRQLPPGWSFASFLPRKGRTEMAFDSDRDGTHALVVILQPSCDVTGATEVPSEHPEMRRYERVTRVTRGFGGERHYVFTGGCVTYRFDLRGTTRAEPVAVMSEALGFLSRNTVARRVRDTSDGRQELDVTRETG
jgi:hypothetical protein